MKIWAHRGCSQMYPENTLLSFRKAMEIEGLTGIELDIQLTKDGHMVVIHDERVDRTTNGQGFVLDFTLEELKNLEISAKECGQEEPERIPTIEEVLDLLQDKMKEGLKLNIELKNSVYYYEGMEEKIVQLVRERGLEQSVVYSTFYAKSVRRLRELAPEAEIGVLDVKISDCYFKMNGGSGGNALHPFWQGMDLSPEEVKEAGVPVRAWLSGHLYPEKPTGGRLDLERLENMGITDVFLNEPERYV